MGESAEFKDHFSNHAAEYSRFRPTYPEALFAWLSTLVPSGSAVWDCATGNGQGALALAGHFQDIWATDASAEQISKASLHPRIRYGVCLSSASGLVDDGVDLVTVAQALHWFEPEPFHREVQRVLRPSGVVVAWCYELFEITAEVDDAVFELYDGILKRDWSPERRFVERGYQNYPWPWPKLATPQFSMAESWTIEQTLGYLRTWSATRKFAAREGIDPVTLVEDVLRDAWGSAETREVRWPLRLVASRLA
jgi:ubiquinone/menaquinone biosynthesis C-methylase UbiE